MPTADTALGRSYRSPKYRGLRDYVIFEQEVSNPTIQQICLFMPHDAAAIPLGTTFDRRYIIRVWDRNGNEITAKALSLPSDEAVMERNGNRRVIRTITNVECKAMQSVNEDSGELEPVPYREVQHQGTVQFFDTQSGEWTCP
jgi:hypothetical protein